MNVEKLAALLGKEPGVVEKAISEDTLDSIIEEFQTSHQVFTAEELARKLDNHFRSEIEKLGEKSELPPNVYNIAKANAFAKLEKEWAKEYGIDKWEGIKDLRDQIIAKNGSGKSDDEIAKLQSRIDELKQQVLDESKRADEAVKEAEQKYSKELASRDFNSVLAEIPIDAEDETLENQRKILSTMFTSEYQLDVRDGQTVVLKDGNLLTNKVGDPVPLQDVVKEFAPKWVKLKGDPDGGRGGSSTKSKTNGFASMKSADDFWGYIDDKGIKRGSAEMLDELIKFKEAHPEINI